MFGKSLHSIKRNAAVWLRQGISPRRLAFTLALRLNLPAIQAANYVVMPLQLALIVPFVRLGGWLFASGHSQTPKAGALFHASPLNLLAQLGGLAGHAMLAWLLFAVPSVLLLTFTLTVLLRRIPALAAAEAGG